MKLFIFTLLSIFPSLIFAQKVGDIYRVNSQFEANLFVNTRCQADSIDIICKNSIFKIIELSGDTIAKIEMQSSFSNPQCLDFAKVGGIYCINQSILNLPSIVTPRDKKFSSSIGGGVLTIPFKFDPQTFKVFPAGEIGGVGGWRLSHNKSGADILVGGILGLSTIPLNDLNSTSPNEIRTVSGITYGGGVSVNLIKGFQFGVYYGVDLYNANNTKFRKEWFSFGFGYDFLQLIDRPKQNQLSAPVRN